MSSRRLQTGVELDKDQRRSFRDQIARLEQAVRLMRPGVATGTITLWGNATAPSAWVLCNGATYNGTQAMYAQLWSVVGTSFGGTGIAAFKVPALAQLPTIPGGSPAVYIIKL